MDVLFFFPIIPTTIAELTNASRESGLTEDLYFFKKFWTLSSTCAKRNPRNGDHPARRQLAARRDLPRFIFIYIFFFGTVRVGWGRGDFTSKDVTP